MPSPVPLDPKTYRTVPWTNGGGVATDLYGQPGFRLARTRIERPGPFSRFPGQDRILVPIEGSGLLLHRKDAGDGETRTATGGGSAADPGLVLDARTPFQPVAFPGDWALRSTLEDGPVAVLNGFVQRARFTLELVPLRPGQPHDIPPARIVVLHASGPEAQVVLDGERFIFPADGGVVAAPDLPHRVEVTEGFAALAVARARG